MERAPVGPGGTPSGARLLAAVALAAALLASWACAPGEPRAVPSRHAEAARRPDVLLISIDTLRADHLGAYGYGRETSPVIDRLAAEGVLFESHVSSTSWTLPAHAALFSSLPDSVHGATDTDRRLPDAVTTLAERFAAAGFTTAGFFAGPYLHPAFGLDQGFEAYRDCTSYAALLDGAPAEAWAMDPEVMRRSHRDVTNPRVLAAFRAWLAEPREKPFFAFVHLWDVHFDFLPPPPYDALFDPGYEGGMTGEGFFFDPAIHAGMPRRDLDHLVALYDGEIAWTDEHVGRLLAAVDEARDLDRTVVAVTSDHGTEFFEHGFKGHRTTLYDELIRVPLVLRYPPGLAAGVRVAEQTRALDVGPTLLELAGVPAPEGGPGHSLVTLARGGALDFDNAAVSELFSVGHRLRTLRTREWKFYDDLALARRAWTDLGRDPGERGLRPVDSGDGPRLEARYLEAASALAFERERRAHAPDRSTVPEEVRRQLEALGYLSPD